VIKKPEIFNIIGRWERVRFIGSEGCSDPYFWDRKNNTIVPTERGRFWRSPEGLLYPHIRGGVSTDSWDHSPFGFRLGFEDLFASTSIGNHQLNSNYSFGVGGDAVSWRYVRAVTKTLDSWFYRINTISGSPGALTVEIREDDGAGLPGATVALSTTDTPSGTLGWNEITGLSVSLTAGTTYWFILGDAAGGVSDNYRVNTITNWQVNRQIPAQFYMAATTTNGFTSITPSANSPVSVLAFSDSTSWGAPIVGSANPTSNTSQRGLYMDGMNVDFDLFGVLVGDTNINTFSEVQIWKGVSGPSGTPFATSSNELLTTSSNIIGVYFTKSFPRLVANNAHRIVVEWSSANGTTPERLQIGTVNGGGSSRLTRAFPGGGKWYWTEESGGVWVDTTDEYPRMLLMVDDFTPDGGAAAAGNQRSFPILPDDRVFPVLPKS
jgi:hypothetical protein